MAKVKKINLQVGASTTTLEVGDLFSADFQDLEDPAASVKSIVAWAKQLNRILKGISEVTDATSLAKAAGVPDATSFNPIISALSSKGITANSTVQDAVNAVS